MPFPSHPGTPALDDTGSVQSNESQQVDVPSEPPRVPLGLSLASIPPLNLRPLTTYGEPSYKERFNEESLNKKYLHLPSNLASRDYSFTLDELKRKKEAYKLAREAFRRGPIDILLTRTQARKIFKHELNLLNKALTEIYEYTEDGETPLYGLDRHLVSNLTAAIYSRKVAASDDFYRKAITMPEYPTWGDRGNFSQFLELNEFEIASTCFREEVERYLKYLANYHTFPNYEDQEKLLGYDDDEESSDQKGKERDFESNEPAVETQTAKPSYDRFKNRPAPPHLTDTVQVNIWVLHRQHPPSGVTEDREINPETVVPVEMVIQTTQMEEATMDHHIHHMVLTGEILQEPVTQAVVLEAVQVVEEVAAVPVAVRAVEEAEAQEAIQITDSKEHEIMFQRNLGLMSN
ncbi:hypothetical protein C8R43DRAFT_1135396 [Mycena crocata]|nr:hypothetical protein C8R43DRAFT_1135396 [Mycena crocata]